MTATTNSADQPIRRSATLAFDSRFELAEGIIWDDRENVVRWVDILAGDVHSAHLSGLTLKHVSTIHFDHTVGAVALAEDGGLLIAGEDRLVCVSAGGAMSRGPQLIDPRFGKLNDATIDPHGRAIVGSAPFERGGSREVLLRVSEDGTVETIRDGIMLSNGIAFSPDGSRIYHVDSLRCTVARRAYGCGDEGSEEAWEDFLHLDAYPDGMVVDASGDLWIAEWSQGRVSRFRPDGRRAEIIDVNASQPSCPGLVGPNKDILMVTTAMEGLQQPADASGSLFAVIVSTPGLAENRWAGSTVAPRW